MYFIFYMQHELIHLKELNHLYDDIYKARYVLGGSIQKLISEAFFSY